MVADRLVTDREYIDSLKNLLEGDIAPSSVCINTYQMRAGGMASMILPGLHRVLEEGGEVVLAVDDQYSRRHLIDAFSPTLASKEEKELNDQRVFETAAMYQSLGEAGAQVHFLRRPSNFLARIIRDVVPTALAAHTKGTTAIFPNGRKIGWWGGTNINEWGKNDLMVETENPELVNFLDLFLKATITGSLNRDIIEVLDRGRVTMLVDAGYMGSSVILPVVSDLLEGAKENLLMTSQIYPDLSTIRQLISAANRGVQVDVIIPNESHPNLNRFPYGPLRERSEALLKSSSAQINIRHMPDQNSFTHAKILVADRSRCLIGSHNFNRGGTILGMRELSAYMLDRQIAKDAYRIVESWFK